MFNDIKIGPLTLHMYGLMIAIGFISAYVLSVKRGKKRGLQEDVFDGILIRAIIGGLLGTRLLYYIVELPSIIKDPSILWDFSHGFVVYGGVIGGVLINVFYCKKKKVNFWEYFDIVMPSVAFAQGFGRIGCFCAGCCYGKRTDEWYGITFHGSRFAPNGVSLIPTQLLSSAGDFLICGLLILYSKKNPKKGRVGAGYLILYGIGRFLIEFLRNDHRGTVGDLSTSQFISIGIMTAGVVMWAIAAKFKSNQAIAKITEEDESELLTESMEDEERKDEPEAEKFEESVTETDVNEAENDIEE